MWNEQTDLNNEFYNIISQQVDNYYNFNYSNTNINNQFNSLANDCYFFSFNQKSYFNNKNFDPKFFSKNSLEILKSIMISSKLMNDDIFYLIPNLKMEKKFRYEVENSLYQKFMKDKFFRKKDDFLNFELLFDDIPFYENIYNYINNLKYEKIPKECLYKIKSGKINEIIENIGNNKFVELINFLNGFFYNYFSYMVEYITSLENYENIIKQFCFQFNKITNFLIIIEENMKNLIEEFNLDFKEQNFDNKNQYFYYYRGIIDNFIDIVYSKLKYRLFKSIEILSINKNDDLVKEFIIVIEDMSFNKYNINFSNYSLIRLKNIYDEFEEFFIKKVLNIENINIFSMIDNYKDYIENILFKYSEFFVHKTYLQIIKHFKETILYQIKFNLTYLIDKYFIKENYFVNNIDLVNKWSNIINNNNKYIFYSDDKIKFLIQNYYYDIVKLLTLYEDVDLLLNGYINKIHEIDDYILFENKKKSVNFHIKDYLCEENSINEYINEDLIDNLTDNLTVDLASNDNYLFDFYNLPGIEAIC